MKKTKTLSTRELKRKKGIDVKEVMLLIENAQNLMEHPEKTQAKDVRLIAEKTKNILQHINGNTKNNDFISIKKADFTNKMNSLFHQFEEEMNKKEENAHLKININ